MSRNVIQDGYTRNGYIAAEDRLHDEMAFTYRPMYGEAAGLFSSQEFRLMEPARQAAEEAKAIARSLSWWSEVDDKGSAVPLTADNVLRLPQLVRQRVLNIVAGFSPSDLKPDARITPELDEETERLMKAQLTGATLGAVAAAADAKN